MCNLSPPRLPMIHDQQSLTLCWRSFSWWGMEGIAISFADKGSHKCLYDWIHPIGGDISQHAWPKIVDAPLTLRWRSVDAHFHDRAGRVLLSVLPIKAARNSFMTDYNLSEVWFPRTDNQKSLTLHWRSFSWWCREGIANCFAYKGSQKFLYDWLKSIGDVISQDTWRKIVDAPLTLIFTMGQWGYCYLFCL
jgi:hypothetical protein